MQIPYYSVLCTDLHANTKLFRIMYCVICKYLIIPYYVLRYMQIPYYSVIMYCVTALYVMMYAIPCCTGLRDSGDCAVLHTVRLHLLPAHLSHPDHRLCRRRPVLHPQGNTLACAIL